LQYLFSRLLSCYRGQLAKFEKVEDHYSLSRLFFQDLGRLFRVIIRLLGKGFLYQDAIKKVFFVVAQFIAPQNGRDESRPYNCCPSIATWYYTFSTFTGYIPSPWTGGELFNILAEAGPLPPHPL
jgi:hypothetical protein